MVETATQWQEILAHYSSEEVTEMYLEKATEGFWELERAAVDGYFDVEGRVLDLGCGPGRTTSALVELGYDVVGLDLTERFVEFARSFVADAEFVLGDARSLPFEDETFDQALFSYNGIDDMASENERIRTLREIRRVLAPGGIFAFSSHNRWSTYVPNSLTADGLRQLAEFWYRNLQEGRLFSPYKWDNTGVGEGSVRYHIRPSAQKRQLRNCGFEVLAVLRTEGYLEPYVHHPFFVARKPERVTSGHGPEGTYPESKASKSSDC